MHGAVDATEAVQTGDALVSADSTARLIVLTADCASIVLASPEGVFAAVHAGWRGLAAGVIESAAASGLPLAGGPAGNDPLAATTRGTGELIAAAVAAGARRVLVGVGGSATTDAQSMASGTGSRSSRTWTTTVAVSVGSEASSVASSVRRS